MQMIVRFKLKGGTEDNRQGTPLFQPPPVIANL